MKLKTAKYLVSKVKYLAPQALQIPRTTVNGVLKKSVNMK